MENFENITRITKIRQTDLKRVDSVRKMVLMQTCLRPSICEKYNTCKAQ